MNLIHKGVETLKDGKENNCKRFMQRWSIKGVSQINI
jgi:hypothetical protein